MHLHLTCIFPSPSIDTTDCLVGIIPRQDNASNGENCHDGRSSSPLRSRATSSARSGLKALALDDREDAIYSRNRNLFDGAARPANFEFVDFGGGSQSEMDAWVGA